MDKITFRFLFMVALVVAITSILMVIANRDAFAQEKAQTKQHVVHFSAEKGKNVEMVLSAPDPGENLTVIVDVPIPARTRQVTPAPVYVPMTVIANPPSPHESSLHLRGGVGVSSVQRTPTINLAYMAGLVGEIGYTDSPWRLRGRLEVGKCPPSNNFAIGGNLSALHRLYRNVLWVGLGTDLLYCADTNAHSREQSMKRLVGASARIAYELDHLLVEGFLGTEQMTAPIPGGRRTRRVGIGGLSVSYLF